MEAKNLMIGNFIKVNDIPVIVKQVYEDGIIIDIGEGDEECDSFKPIPLTNDFWLKNEFVYQKDDNSYTLFDDYYSINAKEVNDGMWQIVVEHCEIFNDTEICSFSYVHQLQQFLNLCGIYIEIKL